jgi:hypothetical protein
MSSFKNREEAHENKFAHDETLKFKAMTRGAKMFGAWAAEQAGLPKEGYSEEIMHLVTSGKKEADIIKRVKADAEAKGKTFSDSTLEEKFSQCLAEARAQLTQ